MGEKPSPDREREPNLELPQLRLPGFRRKKVRRGQPAAESQDDPLSLAEQELEPADAVGAHRDRGVRVHRPRRLRRKFFTWRGTFFGARTEPSLPGPVAAAVAGVVAGAAGTGTTYGGLRGCEAVNGTPSCGAPGLGLLVAIAIGMVALGALVLRGLRAPEPLGTSLLGGGILVVVVLVGLTGVIFSAWMFLAIPLLAAAAYALAHWVTTRFVEPGEPPPGPDVR